MDLILWSNKEIDIINALFLRKISWIVAVVHLAAIFFFTDFQLSSLIFFSDSSMKKSTTFLARGDLKGLLNGTPMAIGSSIGRGRGNSKVIGGGRGRPAALIGRAGVPPLIPKRRAMVPHWKRADRAEERRRRRRQQQQQVALTRGLTKTQPVGFGGCGLAPAANGGVCAIYFGSKTRPCHDARDWWNRTSLYKYIYIYIFIYIRAKDPSTCAGYVPPGQIKKKKENRKNK